MTRRTVFSTLALLLTVCLLLSSCAPPLQVDFNSHPFQPTAAQTDTVPGTTDPVTEPAYSAVYPRRQNGGSRDYLSDEEIALVPFSEMEYTRPDAAAVCDAFHTLTARVEGSAEAEEILSGFFDIYDQYYRFYTMHTLANIRYYADLGDEFYKEEFEFCEQSSPDVEEAFEGFLIACAHSPEKTDLETQYFGEGFLDAYLDYSVYTNPEYLALSKQEAAVMEEYHNTLDDPQIEFEGKRQSFSELLARYENSAKYLSVLETYYDTYNPTLGAYYIRLIGIRRQMAEVLGYDSYAEFCYEQTYCRDYTPQQGVGYLADIRRELVPLYQELAEAGLLYTTGSRPMRASEVREALSGVVSRLGGTFFSAYNFMEYFDLCDLSESAEKMDTSFTTYLFAYETPYILINATGTTEDVFTLAHEFGHFTDNLYTYHADEDLETAETFSQGMEWLALCRLEDTFSERELESLRVAHLADTVSVFVSQAAYSDFENRVYALSEEELTVQALNDIYRSICKDYGFYSPSADFYYSMAWVDIPHFFEAPYYMISYCVSSDTALQIYQRELEDQSGLSLYCKLLDRTPGDGLLAVLQQAGMEDPFQEGRIPEISAFLQKELGLS